MRFTYDEDPLLLQSTVRDFLEKECTPEVVRALWETETARSPELWKKLAEIGVPGLLVSEARGGLGFSEIESTLLLEEAGRAALAEPVISTAVAVPLLAGLPDGALAAEWLPRIAAGEAIVAVGHPVSPFVSDAHVADLLLLPEGEDGIHAVPGGQVTIVPQPANDPSRRIASVEWNPSADTRVAEGEVARALLAGALDRGALACAAGALGAADRILTLSVEYTAERKQFGQPIGAFQAVKHMLAGAKVKLEYARPVVQRASYSVAHDLPQASLHVSMAKVAACEAAKAASAVGLQAHGAIGYTWEQDLHLFMRRAWSLEAAWGRTDFHQDRVTEAVVSGAAAIGAGTTFSS